jgi:hypothetical protein
VELIKFDQLDFNSRTMLGKINFHKCSVLLQMLELNIGSIKGVFQTPDLG